MPRQPLRMSAIHSAANSMQTRIGELPDDLQNLKALVAMTDRQMQEDRNAYRVAVSAKMEGKMIELARIEITADGHKRLASQSETLTGSNRPSPIASAL